MKKKQMFLAALFCATPLVAHAAGTTVCEKLAAAKVADTTITSAATVAPGTLQLPPNPFAPIDPKEIPAFCRVQGTIHPTSDSDIGFELWMPSSGWNGRYLQLGNGGLAGSINTDALAGKVKAGYAVAATDDGHKGGGTDGSWAAGHPEKVVDFAYRAVHETSRVSKALLEQFYGVPAKYTYFNGCSEGGREAMMEAQRYPRDFNGILAGAPAHDWINLLTAFAWNAQALSSKESFISEAKRPAIEQAAVSACPSPKGVGDKFIDDPLACRFDPAVLLCKEAESDACLTAPQVEALKKVYGGPKNPRTGTKYAPGYEPGAEAEAGIPGITFASYVFGAAPGASLDALFSSAFFGNFVFDNPKWNFSQLNFDNDIALTKKKLGFMDATNPDLSEFRKAGGKLLHYHGWNDGSPSPLQSLEYYRAVEKSDGGAAKTQAYYELYLVPGMMHCGFGEGPNAFGNMTDFAPSPEPKRNIAIALEQWVEEGKAPAAIIATKYVDDNPAKGVAMTRPLCAYPAIAKWNGQGKSSAAENWSCVQPGTK